MKTIIGRKFIVIKAEYVIRQVYCWLSKVLRRLVALNLLLVLKNYLMNFEVREQSD